jgi:hypothetical protein
MANIYDISGNPDEEDIFGVQQEFIRDEILCVECPTLTIGRWGFGPARRIDIRVAVREDLSIDVARLDGKGRVNRYIRESTPVADSINRLIKAIRRERSLRITRSETRSSAHAVQSRVRTPAPHPDSVREQEWQQGEEQRRQALLRQQIDASLQIQQLRERQHKTRHFTRSDADGVLTPFQNDMLPQDPQANRPSTSSVFRKDALERMFRPTA